MGISASVTNNQITASVGETQIDVAVSGGVGPTGSSGTVAVSAPITNAGTTTAANIGLSVGTGLAVSGGSLVVSYGTGSTVACRGDDARLSDAREWSASTVTQAEAEAGSSTTRRAFTPQRVFQSIAAWWAASASKTKLDGIATGATANATDAQLRDRSTHTGTQTASTISDFTSAVVAAAPPTTNASLLTSGTLPDARLSSNIARTSDVSSAVAAVVNSAPATLDTLKELADALGSDANFSTTVTNALAAKAPLASPTFTGTVSGITKSMVGLGNVDNTSDASKPVSTAQAAADAAVASAAASDATTKANAAQAAAVQRANHTGTQAISTVSGLQDALDGKAPTSHAHGNITSAGAIGSTSGQIVVTTTSGVLTTAASLGWSLISSTPTTLAGYGITDAVASNDSRLTNARTPTAHKASHATGGTDALTPSDIGAAALTHAHNAIDVTAGVFDVARLPVGQTSTTVAAGNDARFTDARTPTDGSVTDAKISSGGLSASSINWVAIQPWAANTAYAKGDLVSFQGIAYRRSVAGTSSGSFVATNWQQITPSEFVASQITSGTVADARLSANVRQSSDILVHPFLLAGM